MKIPTPILQHPSIKRGRQTYSASKERVSSQNDSIDHALQGGLPAYGFIRLICPQGAGEVLHHLPILKNIQSQKKHIIFVNPPAQLSHHWFFQHEIAHEQCLFVMPNNEQETLWSVEQCLRSEACGCVLFWSMSHSPKLARRLQVIASHHQTLLLCFDHSQQHREVLPVALDWQWEWHQQQWYAHIHKIQGSWARTYVPITLPCPYTNTAINAAFTQSRQQQTSISLVSE